MKKFNIRKMIQEEIENTFNNSSENDFFIANPTTLEITLYWYKVIKQGDKLHNKVAKIEFDALGGVDSVQMVQSKIPEENKAVLKFGHNKNAYNRTLQKLEALRG